MKVLFLENQDVKLFNIFKKLNIETQIIDDIDDIINEYKKGEVCIFKSEKMDSQMWHLCMGLDIITTRKDFINNNISQKSVEVLTFGEVEFLRELAQNNIGVIKPILAKEVLNDKDFLEVGNILRQTPPYCSCTAILAKRGN